MMRRFSGQFYFILLISLLVFPASRSQAKVYQLAADVGDLVVVQVPGSIFDDLFPTSTATPSASPDGEDPDGYQLDANDHLAIVTGEGLKLNVDGLALPTVSGYAALRFELVAKAGGAPTALHVAVRIVDAGNYDLRVADYDSAEYSLKLKVTSAWEEKSYDLKANSRILFPAAYMEAILFAGDGTPGAGERPTHNIGIEAEETTIFAGAGGILTLEARPTPGSFTPQTPPQPEAPATNPTPSNPNPSTNTPGGNSDGDTNNIPPGFTAGIGGGGGFLSCALHASGDTTGAPAIAWLLVALGAAVALRFHRVSAKQPRQ